MDDYGVEDLQQLWKFQDHLHEHARVLLRHGLELGALAFALELTKLLYQRGMEPDAELMQQAKINAIKIGEQELSKRMGDARGTDTGKK